MTDHWFIKTKYIDGKWKALIYYGPSLIEVSDPFDTAGEAWQEAQSIIRERAEEKE